MTFIVGWKFEGREDTVPEEYPNAEEARKHLRDEIRWLAEDWPEGDDTDQVIIDKMYDAVAYLEISYKPSSGYQEWTFGPIQYYISPKESVSQPVVAPDWMGLL